MRTRRAVLPVRIRRGAVSSVADRDSKSNLLRRLSEMQLGEGDLQYVLGCLVITAPDALDGALDTLEAWRERTHRGKCCPACGQDDVDGVRWVDMVGECIAEWCPQRDGATAPYSTEVDRG